MFWKAAAANRVIPWILVIECGQ